jgi:predicted N-acetyltransferase YhbS
LHSSSVPSPARFERASLDDLEELLRIHTASFPDPRGRAERVANFVENGHGGFERLFVLRAEGRIVAHAFLFALEVSIGGALVPFGGVATVGVAPEARGRGFGGQLLEALHDEASREGLAGTFLYAFRQGFYRRFGYGRTQLRAVLDASPASFSSGVHAARTRPALTEEDFQQVVALHEDSLARSTLAHRRPERLWSQRRSRTTREWVLAERDGHAVGYLSADRGCAEPHGPVALEIGDFVALDRDAEGALLAWVGSQRDQVERVVWERAAADLERLELVDPDRHRHGTAAIEHPLGTLALGPMVRIGRDLGAFVSRRGWPLDGTVRVGVRGDHGERIGAWSLSVRHGRAHGEALPPLEQVDVEGAHHDLASLMAGGVRLGDLGALHVREGAAVDLAAFFALAPTRVTDAF